MVENDRMRTIYKKSFYKNGFATCLIHTYLLKEFEYCVECLQWKPQTLFLQPIHLADESIYRVMFRSLEYYCLRFPQGNIVSESIFTR